MEKQRQSRYKTKQREAVLSYLITCKAEHITAGQISEHFKSIEQPISTATIYRQLDALVKNGMVKKYTLDKNSGACYQYIDNNECQNHYHIKCEACGALYHTQCTLLDGLQQHILTDHDFEIDIGKTVFYGSCKNCRQDSSCAGNNAGQN